MAVKFKEKLSCSIWISIIMLTDPTLPQSLDFILQQWFLTSGKFFLVCAVGNCFKFYFNF